MEIAGALANLSPSRSPSRSSPSPSPSRSRSPSPSPSRSPSPRPRLSSNLIALTLFLPPTLPLTRDGPRATRCHRQRARAHRREAGGPGQGDDVVSFCTTDVPPR